MTALAFAVVALCIVALAVIAGHEQPADAPEVDLSRGTYRG